MKNIQLLLVFLLNYFISFSQVEENISFSKTTIEKGQRGTEKNFQTGDPIYATALLPKPLKEYFKSQPTAKKYELTIFIYEIKAPLYSYQEPSEEQLTFATMWISGEAMLKNYVTFELAPHADKCVDYSNPDYFFQEFGKKNDGPVNYTENLGKLSSGKHDLLIKIRILDEEISSGRFSITGSDFAYYANQSALLNQVAKSAGAKNAVMPKAMKTDKALESQIIVALRSSND
jgi:hypothetical protein